MSKKKRNKPSLKTNRKKPSTQHLKDQVRNLFSNHLGEAFSIQQIIKSLKIRDKNSKDAIKSIVFKLENSGSINRGPDGKFSSAKEAKLIKGVVDHVNPRFAYIISDEYEEDIWVKSDDLKFAIDGDIVSVMVTSPAKNGFRPEGKVMEILKRSKDEFVGKIEVSQKFSFVVPDNKNLHFDVFVFPENIGKARHNDKVIVKLKKWHDTRNRSPLGEVIRILGKAGENEAEIHSIMAEFGLPFQFPKSVEESADKIPTQFSKADLKSRRDFREITTFTVDPEDAKDFDDALSILDLGKGTYEIGVHIADVSHYVQPKSTLDKEAYERATSVYLVDRTIPMLPEVLSNGLCSLRPNEQKLTFSAVFHINQQNKVIKKWFGRTVIESDRRFTYEEAQERIESGKGDYAKELIILNDMAKDLRDQRFKQGAVNFETTEVKFRLDDKGKPLEVVPKVRKDAHKMIEEFMLLANREVATYVYDMKARQQKIPHNTFVYRTHDLPDPEKLDNFSKFSARFGYKMATEGDIASSLNKLMTDIEGKPEQNVLEQLAIRSMAKAKYTTEPKGHFGLAFEHYTHFTSPIRRYPDVMVHRLLAHYLGGGTSADRDDYEKQCIHSSEKEKNAADAERASIKYKQVEFMETMLGQKFEGLVSGVTEWGIFVEIIDTKCEGMIRLADIEGDFYDFDEKNYRVIGRYNKRIITLGDKLEVLVARTDIDRRTIDLDLVQG